MDDLLLLAEFSQLHFSRKEEFWGGKLLCVDRYLLFVQSQVIDAGTASVKTAAVVLNTNDFAGDHIQYCRD